MLESGSCWIQFSGAKEELKKLNEYIQSSEKASENASIFINEYNPKKHSMVAEDCLDSDSFEILKGFLRALAEALPDIGLEGSGSLVCIGYDGPDSNYKFYSAVGDSSVKIDVSYGSIRSHNVITLCSEKHIEKLLSFLHESFPWNLPESGDDDWDDDGWDDGVKWEVLIDEGNGRVSLASDDLQEDSIDRLVEFFSGAKKVAPDLSIAPTTIMYYDEEDDNEHDLFTISCKSDDSAVLLKREI